MATPHRHRHRHPRRPLAEAIELARRLKLPPLLDHRIRRLLDTPRAEVWQRLSAGPPGRAHLRLGCRPSALSLGSSPPDSDGRSRAAVSPNPTRSPTTLRVCLVLGRVPYVDRPFRPTEGKLERGSRRFRPVAGRPRRSLRLSGRRTDNPHRHPQTLRCRSKAAGGEATRPWT
jgi:hypothetical protein